MSGRLFGFMHPWLDPWSWAPRGGDEGGGGGGGGNSDKAAKAAKVAGA